MELKHYFLRIFYTKYSKLKKIYNYNKITKEILIKCPACSCERLNHFDSIDRYGYNVITNWCYNCGLIFVNPRIDLKNYNKLYMDGHYRKIIQAVSKRKQNKLDTVPKRVNLVLSRIKEIFKNKEVNILDIGGTTGIYEYLDKNLKLKKYLCINPGGDEADIGNSSKSKIVNTTIEEFEINNEKFDLIILFGTISHLMFPYEAFLKVKQLLKNDGIFVLDFKDTLNRMERSYHPFHLIHFDHPLYFSKDSLQALVLNVGLTISERLINEDGVENYFLSKSNNPKKNINFKVQTGQVSVMAERIKNTSIIKILSSKLHRIFK